MGDKLCPMWAHQAEAVRRARELPDYALFFEQGCGKSRTTLEILRERFNAKGEVLRTLIFCPPIVVSNWVDEWKMFTKINPKLVVPLIGPGAKRIRTFNKEAFAQGHSFSAGELEQKIFITNYEALLMKDLYREFLIWEPQIVVFDESHKLKSPSTRRSKLANDLANPFDTVAKKKKPKPSTFLLSGTPVLNSPMDIYQQFKVLDGGHTFGTNYFAFRARYFRDRNAAIPRDRYFPKWEPMTKRKDGFDALGEIKEKIASKSMRVLKSECLDLPPEISVLVKCEMSPEQVRLYKEMKNELLTYFKSKAVVATLAITKALRLMQITSGYVSAESPGDSSERVELALEETPKIKALRELLEEIVLEGRSKVLVWAVFKHNYAQIRTVLDELKIKYVEVHGDVSDSKKRLAVEAFKSDSEIKVFLGHPGSAGLGINLTVAAYSIFYSRNFSLEHYLQARARNHRGGSREAGHASITHYDLVCEGTIDELAVKKLSEKQDLSDKLLGWIGELEGQKY